MVGRLLRSSLSLFAVALGLLAQPLHAQAPAGTVAAKTYTGFFNNSAVYFTAFETNSSNFARVNGLTYAPRLSQANRQAIPQMLFFTNGGVGQTVVLQTAPGQANYSPLWQVLTAQWRGSGPMPLIASYADAVYWNRLGRLLVQNTGIIFNGPVVWVGMNLNRQGGQLAPTLSPAEFVGINPAARAVYFKAHQGYYAGQLVAFLALEHAPGVISFAPGAIPVPTIGVNFLTHNAIANFYVVQGQDLPIIDSFPTGTAAVYTVAGKTPAPQGTGQTPPVQGTGQTPPVQGTGQNGQTGQQPGTYTPPPSNGGGYTPPPSGGGGQPAYAGQYSPIWHIHFVQFRPGVAPQPLRSVQEIQQAFNLGWVTVNEGGADFTFNCPVVSGAQSYTPPPSNGGGNPYTPPPSNGGGNPYTPPPSNGGGNPYPTPGNGY